jgi:hypothetical protein
MLELSVAAPLADLPPTVPFDQLDHLTDLHSSSSDDPALDGTVGSRA